MRASFELAVIGDKGQIITVTGSAGLPGAECCTIYQLPPNGDYAFVISLPPNSPHVGSVELTVKDDWIDWAGINPPKVTIQNPSLTAPVDFSQSVHGPRVDRPGRSLQRDADRIC